MADAFSNLIEFANSDCIYRSVFEGMRLSLFSGFLTISGFLFAAHTFVIVTLKKEVYDTNWYQKRVLKHRALNAKLSFYGPLKRLSAFILRCLIASLVSAFMQMTIGLYRANWSALVCILAAIVAFVFLVSSVLIIRSNLNLWFNEIEQQANESIGNDP